MRIAVLYWSRQKIGGAEAYIETIISELVDAGHQLAFWHESAGPRTNDRIKLPDGVPAWCVDELGSKSALDALHGWSPDVLYTHCLMNLKLEAETFKIAPAVFFAHAYYGTCISGNKSFSRPVPTPCHRRFGWQCLVNYYPHGCGGSSPFTMVKDYRRQSKRLEQLQNYRAVVTHSEYMRDEHIKHGFDSTRVRCLSYYDHQLNNLPDEDLKVEVFSNPSLPVSVAPSAAPRSGLEEKSPAGRRLLFLGRMDRLKGGEVLIDALPYVSEALGQTLHVTFAGDGPMRKVWENQAAQVQARTPGVQIDFTGWVTGNDRESLWNNCDLLVVPSLWPEPFGLVGFEAGKRGIPTAAFAVGGIPEWLVDGVNGYLAFGDPPTSRGLAEAIFRCLRDPEIYERLQRGTLLTAGGFNMQNHLSSLLQTLEQAMIA